MRALIDLHTHTIVSGHAYSTLQENVEAAAKRELKYLGVSDHAPAMPGGPHAYYFSNLRILPEKINGVRILKGCEVNVMDYDGNVDLPEKELSMIEYAIASLHPPCIPHGDREQNTTALIKAMDIKPVKIIGHPDDARYPLDYKRLVAAAIEKNILLEINNSSLSPATFRENARENLIEMLKECREQGAKIIMGSDAHVSYDIGNFKYAEALLEEVGFPEELIVNYNEDDIFKYFFNK